MFKVAKTLLKEYTQIQCETRNHSMTFGYWTGFFKKNEEMSNISLGKVIFENRTMFT